MHIVLTHDQADFDAVASLHAAALLDPDAVAVLPPRVNRNVRGFLTLYGEQLPLVELSDLRPKRVSRITLVDTQTMLSVKGHRRDTEVNVIDHHPGESDLDPRWTAHVEPVGATTTLLVEALQEANIRLEPSSATLLLLGIYEDTGSLSYAGTTSRDVRASAWLLDWNANLAAANDFLNPPLSNGQRALYDRLIDSAETFEYHGLSIMIALAPGEGIADEISSLAHKLADVFDVSGLFLLVSLNGKVQMVARSTSDHIDVSRIAERFGGGGHSRAAAALIRSEDLESLKHQLVETLNEVIEPVVSVEEIMSRDPQMLQPAETIAEAAARMQRYGHEGYPVVDKGEVVGLLTRRAVDRAMSHGMSKRPVSEIMEAGDVVVQPGHSIRHLQRVMMEHNWGQVPVVDPASGAVVGIVTRTDLLNTLANDSSPAAEAGLVDKLENALPPSRLALLRLIAKQAERSEVALYLVGGFVRDLCLGTPSVDFDLVVEGDAIGLAQRLADLYGGRISSHRRFGTAKWRLDGTSTKLLEAVGAAQNAASLPELVDFVSARTEFYAHPTALPSVSRGSIKLDLHRRDFSINTLAVRLDGRYYGQLLDHWGGGRDLREQQIRVLHSLSFVDDPTRMLRAVRLEQRLGFEIEARTLELLNRAVPLLEGISGDRIRSDLDLILREAKAPDIMARLDSLGLIQAIHPRLVWQETMTDAFRVAQRFEPPQEWKLESEPRLQTLLYALWLAPLQAADAEAVTRRLQFSASDQDVVISAGRLRHDLAAMSEDTRPSEVAACLDGVTEGALVATWLSLATDPAAQQRLHSYLAEWRWVRPRTTGDTLRDLGMPPGPEYRQILATLRNAWLDGELTSAAAEQAMLDRLTKEIGARG